MAEKKRQCGTCRFFIESETHGHGKCTHPKRDKALREMVLLRPNELGCRTRWGTSLWQDPKDDSEPAAPEVPQQPALPEPIAAHMQYDDEVTSVSIAGSTSTRPSFDDDVVDSGAVATGMGSWNDTLQEERRRLLMHGERDALAGARKRHMEKQSRQRELIPFADDAQEPSKPETPAAAESPTEETSAPVASVSPAFPPDDYVEEERGSESNIPSHEDALVDDGVRPGGTRSPRSRRLMRETKSPKDHKAMRLGLPSEMSVTSNNPEQREQWNSVPMVTPGIDLPFANTTEARPSAPLRISASMAPMAVAAAPTRLVSQAREMKTEDRQRQERARRRVAVPLANEDQEPQPEQPRPSVTDRPRLDHAPEPKAPPVERLKSSPLRGYHPAVKAKAQPTNLDEAPRPQQPARETTEAIRADRPVQQTAMEHQPVVRQEERPVQMRRPERPMHGHQQRVPERRIEASEQREQPRMEAPRRRPLAPVQETSRFERKPITIAPSVPRACGTCSSFRPNGEGGRGSCTNAFAGPVQRVVHAEDMACQHTFGSFWLPADKEVGLDDIATPDVPTPRVDRMIARRRQRTVPVLPDLEELTS